MVRILGLDISSTFVFACLLTEPVDNPREWFRQKRNTVLKYTANETDLKALLELKPNYAVLEPTGMHYSKLWALRLAAQGCQILWVGHAQLKSYRITLRLPNKNDAADAFALAQYGQQYLNKDGYFLSLSIDSLGYRLREKCLQLKYIEELTVPIKNRLRQQLAHEWPEVAKRQTNGTLWKFIAGDEVPKNHKTRLERLQQASIGSGLSEFSRFLATELISLEEQIKLLETEIKALCSEPTFRDYRQVFRRYGFGSRVSAMVLAHIYPFENFLGFEGKEIIETVKSKNGKPSKRYRSLKAFKLAVGSGLVEDSSGKTENWVPGGSALCREALWQWLFSCIEPKKSRPKTPECQYLGQLIDSYKAAGTPVKLARSRVIHKAVEMLFYDLLESLYP